MRYCPSRFSPLCRTSQEVRELKSAYRRIMQLIDRRTSQEVRELKLFVAPKTYENLECRTSQEVRELKSGGGAGRAAVWVAPRKRCVS